VNLSGLHDTGQVSGGNTTTNTNTTTTNPGNQGG
jgi:hypothetical protein